MATDSELVERLQTFLRTSDLNTTTGTTVRRKLEKDFSIDLSDRKAFIREQIGLFLEAQVAKPQNDDVEEEIGEEDEAKESESVKKEESNDNGPEEKLEEGEPEVEVEVEVEEEEEDDDEEEEGEDEKQGLDEEDKGVKKRGRGFSKPCGLSPKLQEFVGAPELARTEVVKRIWAYIREKNLQNPKDRRKILCDETLHALFHVKSIDMFKMNKALAKHIWPIEDYAPVKLPEKERKSKRVREEGSDEPKLKTKLRKGAGSGFLVPLPLSDALVKFFGTGENALSRADVVKRMWQYIKQNDLQDPTDKRRIICDDKLKELFDVDTFNGFMVTKLLTAHFIKAE